MFLPLVSLLLLVSLGRAFQRSAKRAPARIVVTQFSSPDSKSIDSISSFVSAAAAAYPLLKVALERLAKSLPMATALFPSFVSGDYCNYVSRAELEDLVLKAYGKSLKAKGGTYTILVGPKGAGKSTLVAHVLTGKKGVVFLGMSNADDPRTFLRRLLATCGENVVENNELGLDVIFPSLVQAAISRDGVPITFVFEVERGGSSSDAVLYLVKSAAKQLAIHANVIIVLSDANAGLGFGDDKREQVVWVGEMGREEATEYARKIHPNANANDLELLFDKVGTLPLDVFLSAQALLEGKSASGIVEAAVESALEELEYFLHKPIVDKLKLSPDGVSARAFREIKHEGVLLREPKLVAPAMKLRNAIIYHLPSGQYRVATRAHRTALVERYNV